MDHEEAFWNGTKDLMPRQMLSSYGYMAVGVYLTILGVVATLGNTFVIVVVLRRRMLCKSFNHLIFNLALADLCVAVSGYPLNAASGFAEKWIFGHFGCIFSAFIIFMLSMVSINTMLVIAVFRYIFICQPQYNYLTNVSNMKYVIGAIWGHAVIWTGFPLVGWSSYHLEPYGVSCTLNWTGRSISEASYSISSLITCYIFHITVITFCYVKIIFKARTLQFGIVSKRGCFELEKLLLYHKLQVEKKVTTICVIMVFAFFTVWTPYALFSLLSVIGVDLPVSVMCLPTMFAKLSCASNPVIYTAGSSRFRRALSSLVSGQKQASCSTTWSRARHGDWLATTIMESGVSSSRDPGSCIPLKEQEPRITGRTKQQEKKDTNQCLGDLTKNGIYIGPANVQITVESSAF